MKGKRKMIDVKCQTCGKVHKIKPDGLGRIMPNLVTWYIYLKQSCCNVTEKRKQEGAGACDKCGKPAVIMTQEGPGPFGLINYCEECFEEKAEQEGGAK